MRAPRCPQAWAWLALMGLAFVTIYQQTGVDAVRPNNNSQKAKIHFVCKEGEDCLAWPVRKGRNGMKQFLNATECGVVRLKPSALQQAQMKLLQSANKALGFYCKTIRFIGANKKKRLRRQSGPRRGKFRGQTQSQYLNIGGHDNGKAEALSDADSSRALVSGKSGMGQAQSQSVYDPSCEECLGGGSDIGAENIRHSSGPILALNNDGRFPTLGYSNRPVESDTESAINPNNVNLQSPGSGPSSNNGNYGTFGGPSGPGNPYQPPWNPQQSGGPNQNPGQNYPNQGSFNAGIPSLNQTPTQQGTGFVNGQGVPRNIPGLSMQIPNTGQTAIPNNGPIDRNGQIPNNGPIDRNGQIPNNRPIDSNIQIPNNGPMERNGQIPINNGPMDRNGQIPINGPMDRNGQIPNNGLIDRNNGQEAYNGPIDRNGQVAFNGPIDRNEQIPNNMPMERNGHVPSNGPIDRNGQMPNNGQMDRNGHIPYIGPMDRNSQTPNNDPMYRNVPIPNNRPTYGNGQLPNNGPMDRTGQVFNNAPIEKNGQIPNSRPKDRNGHLPHSGPVERTYPQTDQNISNGFSQKYPDGSRKPSQSNPDRFDQTPALYPGQYPSTSYVGNLGPSMFPGQMSSQPAITGNGGNVSPLDNRQQTSFFPGQTIPTQGTLQTQDRNSHPIPYEPSSASFIGPNGETYVCCVVAPNKNGQEFGNKFSPNIGQPRPQQLGQPQPGTQGQTNYAIARSPEQNSQYELTGPQGSQNALAGQGTVGLNYLNNQPGSTYGIRGHGENTPSSGAGGSHSSHYGDQMVPIDGSGSQGNTQYTSGRQNTYPQGSSLYNGNQGTPYYTTGQNPTTQTAGRDIQGPAFSYPYQIPNEQSPFTNGGDQSPYHLRGQEPNGNQGTSYYNGGQSPNTYPISNQNTPYDSQRQDFTPLGSETPYYNYGKNQNIPLTGNGGQNLPYDKSSHDQSSTTPIVGASGGPLYFNPGQSIAPFNANSQKTPYSTSGGQNPVPANNIPFTNSLGQSATGPSFQPDVKGTPGYPYGVVNRVSPQGEAYIPGNQNLPSQSSTGGTRLDIPWNNGSPFGTSSVNLGPGQTVGQTGSQQGGQGQTLPATMSAQYPPLGNMGQAPTQEQGRNGEHRPIPSDRNMQNPSPGSYVIGNRGQEITPHSSSVLQENFPEGQVQPVGSSINTLLPGNQKEPVHPPGKLNNLYPGAQSTGLSNEQGPYNTIKGTGNDPTAPGFTQTSIIGTPQNEFDPNTITSEKDESEAQASITHDFNGTIAIASSKGGNEKGKANTQVQGSYTGSGSFSAQAQITDDDDKGAESQVSGGKEGATSNALGKGKKNKSQANVQLGSETGSLQTQSQSESKHHSTNSQVHGGVKGGMADAQARGPGSTSSQAQIGFTPYKDGDKAHDILKTPFVGVGSASAQSNGKTGQSQSQLQGTFKYGITYNGAAQSGASIDKDAVFENRMPYKKVDVFGGEKNIEVDTEIPLPLPKLDIDDNEQINNDNHELDHPHAVHHKTDEQPKNTTPNGITRSFVPNVNNDKEKDYEFEPNREEISPGDYDGEGGDPPEYYDEFPREQDTGIQHVNAANRRNIDVQQTTRGNTQRIVLGNLQDQNADIVQKSSEYEPDYRRIYQPGERVPGTGGYIIPAGFTGTIQAISSRDKTIALGSRESPSQAQTVSLTPGNGQINYITTKPVEYAKSVNANQLKSLNNNKPDDNRYMTVSKSVSGALDEDNKIKKEYSHTYYTKSSSCGYFTFTCTMVRGTNGTKKVCKPKIPKNPDGSPIKC